MPTINEMIIKKLGAEIATTTDTTTTVTRMTAFVTNSGIVFVRARIWIVSCVFNFVVGVSFV